MSHWWTTRHFVAAMEAGETATPAAFTAPAAAPTAPVPLPQPVPVPQPVPAPAPDPVPMLVAAPAPAADPSQKEFFEALLDEIRALRGENRDLRDQMAETNRDVIKLEFRVDTHSESFRPLPVAEDRFETTFDHTFDPRFQTPPGVLPPLDFPGFLHDE